MKICYIYIIKERQIKIIFTKAEKDMSVTDQHLAAYIETVFANYDKDNSGTLQQGQLTAFLNDMYRTMGAQQSVSPQQAQQALGIMDKDFNGRVSKAQLFEVFKYVLMKQGFYVNDQNIFTNTGHNYNDALGMWKVSQQMGQTLPYFGQALSANISQGVVSYSKVSPLGVNQYGNMNNQYGVGNQSGDINLQKLQNEFVKSHFNVQSPEYKNNNNGNVYGGSGVELVLRQQIELNEMLAVQNEMLKQYQNNTVQQQQQYENTAMGQQQAQLNAQLAQQQAQVNMQLNQIKMHTELLAAQQEMIKQQHQQMINQHQQLVKQQQQEMLNQQQLMVQQQQQMIQQQNMINMNAAGYNPSPNSNYNYNQNYNQNYNTPTPIPNPYASYQNHNQNQNQGYNNNYGTFY